MTSGGFYAGIPDAWEVAAEHIPTPWPDACMRNDLRWWADRVRMGRAQELPSVSALVTRWGRSRTKVSAIRSDVATWADPHHIEACEQMVSDALGRAPACSRRSGQEADSQRTASGQAADRPAAPRAISRVQIGQAADREQTGSGQREDPTRAVPYSQTQDHNPQEQQAAGAAAEPARPARHAFADGWARFESIRQEHQHGAQPLDYRVWQDRWRRLVSRVGSVDVVIAAWECWWLAPEMDWWRRHRTGIQAVGTFMSNKAWAEWSELGRARIASQASARASPAPKPTDAQDASHRAMLALLPPLDETDAFVEAYHAAR